MRSGGASASSTPKYRAAHWRTISADVDLMVCERSLRCVRPKPHVFGDAHAGGVLASEGTTFAHLALLGPDRAFRAGR